MSAAKAYVRAGGSARSASQASSKFIARPRVQAALAARARKLTERCEITTEAVLNELALVGFSNMYDFLKIEGEEVTIDFSNLTRQQAAAIGEVTINETKRRDGTVVTTTKFKLHNKLQALEQIAKFLGMLVKVRHTTPDGDEIEVEARPSLEVARRYAFLLDREANRDNGGSGTMIEHKPTTGDDDDDPDPGIHPTPP